MTLFVSYMILCDTVTIVLLHRRQKEKFKSGLFPIEARLSGKRKIRDPHPDCLIFPDNKSKCFILSFLSFPQPQARRGEAI